MARRSLTAARALIADPRDRFLAPIDPWLRNAKKRFTAIVVGAVALHIALLIFLLLRDHSKAPAPENEVPVEVVVMPPPPPLQPEAKPQPKPEPQPKEKERAPDKKPATDTPPAANTETVKREASAQQTSAPTLAKPTPAPAQPTPDKPQIPTDAPPQPDERTAAPEAPEEKPDAEVISKAAPLKDPKMTEKQQPAKAKAQLPSNERAELAKQFAALTQSPQFSLATVAKPSPVSGGHCTADPYLCTLFGLIMRQQRYPEAARAQHLEGRVVIAFWVDERGDLTHQALYKTSGHPLLDAEAMATVHRAAPFPPPPPGSPHGFVAQMEFPPK